MKDLVVYSTQSPDGTQWIDTNSPIDLSATDPAALKAFIDLAGSVAEEPGVQEAIDRKWREQQQRGHLDESFELLEHMSSASGSLGVGSLEVLTPPQSGPPISLDTSSLDAEAFVRSLAEHPSLEGSDCSPSSECISQSLEWERVSTPESLRLSAQTHASGEPSERASERASDKASDKACDKASDKAADKDLSRLSVESSLSGVSEPSWLAKHEKKKNRFKPFPQGLAPSEAARATLPTPTSPDDDYVLATLLDMGFTEAHAQRAMAAGKGDVQLAIEAALRDECRDACKVRIGGIARAEAERRYGKPAVHVEGKFAAKATGGAPTSAPTVRAHIEAGASGDPVRVRLAVERIKAPRKKADSKAGSKTDSSTPKLFSNASVIAAAIVVGLLAIVITRNPRGSRRAAVQAAAAVASIFAAQKGGARARA